MLACPKIAAHSAELKSMVKYTFSWLQPRATLTVAVHAIKSLITNPRQFPDPAMPPKFENPPEYEILPG
jgi:hypothetical protein